jgi:hypothetical protein
VRPAPLALWIRLLGATCGGALGYLLSRALRGSKTKST